MALHLFEDATRPHRLPTTKNGYGSFTTADRALRDVVLRLICRGYSTTATFTARRTPLANRQSPNATRRTPLANRQSPIADTIVDRSPPQTHGRHSLGSDSEIKNKGTEDHAALQYRYDARH